MIKDLRSHTTLPASDLSRAKKFYAEKLSLSPSTESPGGLFYVTAGGTRFTIYPTPNPTRGGHTQMGFSVNDIEGTVAELQAAGVVFEEYDFPGLKTVGGVAQTGERGRHGSKTARVTSSAWFSFRPERTRFSQKARQHGRSFEE